MGKRLQETRYALLMYDANDQRVNGMSSSDDLAGARVLAISVLFLMPQLGYIHIYAYDAAGVMAPEPLERIDWDHELMAAF